MRSDYSQQRVIGVQTRDTILQNAAIAAQFANNLAAEQFKNAKVQEYVNILIEGYQKEAAANQAYAQLANEEGIVSVRSDADQQQWDAIQSQQKQAAAQIELGYNQLVSFCSI